MAEVLYNPDYGVPLNYPFYYTEFQNGDEIEDEEGKIQIISDGPIRMATFYDDGLKRDCLLITGFIYNYETQNAILRIRFDDSNEVKWIIYSNSYKSKKLPYFEIPKKTFDTYKKRVVDAVWPLIKKSANQNIKKISITSQRWERFAYVMLYGETKPTELTIPVQWQTDYRAEPYEASFEISIT